MKLRSTESGRLYFEAKDFFADPGAQKQIIDINRVYQRVKQKTRTKHPGQLRDAIPKGVKKQN